MTLLERLDAVCDRWDVLRHPFYRAWEAGDLTRDDLAYYAGEYRHAVCALADVASSDSTPDHGAEEREHVALWDDFAHALDADTTRVPRAETAECTAAWREGGLGALYAIESTQPDVARTKLDGLVRWYGFAPEDPATEYFSLHAERDVEHAEQTRARLATLPDREGEPVVRAAEQALRGNWALLDGVQRHVEATRAG